MRAAAPVMGALRQEASAPACGGRGGDALAGAGGRLAGARRRIRERDGFAWPGRGRGVGVTALGGGVEVTRGALRASGTSLAVRRSRFLVRVLESGSSRSVRRRGRVFHGVGARKGGEECVGGVCVVNGRGERRASGTRCRGGPGAFFLP